MNPQSIRVSMPGVSDGTAPAFSVSGGTGAKYDVGGANVIWLFPVYDVVYTYAPLNLRTG